MAFVVRINAQEFNGVRVEWVNTESCATVFDLDGDYARVWNPVRRI